MPDQTIIGTGVVGGSNVTATTTLPMDAPVDDPSTPGNESVVTISHSVTAGTSSTGKINLAIVLDSTSSTEYSAGFDVDGDGSVGTAYGSPDSIFNAQKQAALKLFQSYMDAGYDPADIQITLVTFTSPVTTNMNGYVTYGPFNLTPSGQANFNTTVNGLNTASGSTSFESGLNGVNAQWTSLGVSPDDSNHVVFLTDGVSNRGNSEDGLNLLQNNFGASVSAIGIGAMSTGYQSSLDAVDNTGGGTIIATGPGLAGLADLINLPPPNVPLDEVEITFEYIDINGNPVTVTHTYEVGAPGSPIIANATGYFINGHEITLNPPPQWINGNTSEIKVTVVSRFEDGTEIPTSGNVGYIDVVCFGGDTLIDTDRGPRRAIELRIGDLVRTVDHGLQPVRWIGIARLPKERLRHQKNLRPVRIKAGALGNGIPSRDVLVSPQHRLLVTQAEAGPDSSEILVAAKKLLDLPGVEIAKDIDRIDYVHILLDAHELIYAEGSVSETLFLGPQALKMIPRAQRNEIEALFPDLDTSTKEPARAIPMGKDLKRILARMSLAEDSRKTLQI